MRLAAALTLAAAVTGCGPDVTAWKGTWSGTASVNTGRQPLIYTGTLTIADGALFTATSDAQGSPAQSFTCALTAASADAGKVSFASATGCTLTATPADSCSYKVTFDAAEATRNGQALEATGHGRMTASCTGASDVVTDFALTLSATRR